MADQKDLFTRLKKMFSTDVIVRNVGGKNLKVIDTDQVELSTDRNSLRDRFNRLRSSTYNLHNRDMSMAYQASRLELFRDYDCIGPDTVIPLPDGTRPTIKELTEKYKDNPQERFYVFSYDHETDSIKLGNAYHPRKKKGKRQGYKVTFDNGQYITASLKHPFMMRDGTYKRTFELRVGDSVMPFYQKEYGCKEHGFKRYRRLYNFSKGWQQEHKIVSNKQRSDTLKEAFKDRDQSGSKNPKRRDDVTFHNVKQKAYEYYKEYSKINLWDFIKHIHCDHSTLQNRLKKEGHDWKTFKNEIVSTLNHKVVSIEQIGEIDVYDVTVEKYENFATDSCFVSNTMDMDPILASALDIYSDECLVPSEYGKILTIHSDNDNIKKILENLFYDILNIEFNMNSWTRNMCKYGDMFLRLEISPEYGVFLVHPISPYEITRVEGSDPKNLNYVKYQHDGMGGGMEYENFEIAHFRLLSDSNFLPYGKSIIEPARRVWKQLSLMEDAMLIHRIMRAPEKRMFYIDVGNIPPADIDAAMQKVIGQVKKVPYIDERTGDYNLRFNLNNMIEDFYLPVRGSDSGTRIDTLPGMEFTGIDDLEYIRNKLMAALKIPKAFLGYEEGLSGKATLAAEDVRFSRTIGKIQRVIVSELTKIAVVHLYVQGYKDASLVDFKLELHNPSTIFEQEKLEIWSNKVAVANDMMEAKLFSKRWIFTNVFNLSEDEVETIQDEVIKDQKELWRMSQISEEGNDPSTSAQKMGKDGPEDIGGGGMDGGMGGDMGGSDLPDLGSGDSMDGPDSGGAGLPELEETKNPEDGVLDEETRKERERGLRPSQDGNKDKYTSTHTKTFGEDPLGNKENKEKSKSDRQTRHIYRGSPLSLREDLKNIKLSMRQKHDNKQKKTIVEKISMLDESNLINEDKHA